MADNDIVLHFEFYVSIIVCVCVCVCVCACVYVDVCSVGECVYIM